MDSPTGLGNRRLHAAGAAESWFNMKPEIDPKLLENPVFRELMAEGLAMQDRFAAEPVYARTGKGFLKSEGVKPLQKIKDATKSREG